MNATVSIPGKSFHLDISAAARQQLDRRAQPLCPELELYYSCLIRKRVCVREPLSAVGCISLTQRLLVGLRPVVTRTCSLTGCGSTITVARGRPGSAMPVPDVCTAVLAAGPVSAATAVLTGGDHHG